MSEREDEIDFAADVASDEEKAAATPSDKLNQLRAMADKMKEAEAELMQLNARVAEAAKRLLNIQTVEIPTAMKELGITALKLNSGETLEYKPDINIGIPEELRPQAFAWLESPEVNQGGIIKTQVSLTYGKGELEKAKEMHEKLLAEGFEPLLKREINWQTLKAWAKERIAAGLDVPAALFGLSTFDKAKFTKPKKAKA